MKRKTTQKHAIFLIRSWLINALREQVRVVEEKKGSFFVVKLSKEEAEKIADMILKNEKWSEAALETLIRRDWQDASELITNIIKEYHDIITGILDKKEQSHLAFLEEMKARIWTRKWLPYYNSLLKVYEILPLELAKKTISVEQAYKILKSTKLTKRKLNTLLLYCQRYGKDGSFIIYLYDLKKQLLRKWRQKKAQKIKEEKLRAFNEYWKNTALYEKEMWRGHPIAIFEQGKKKELRGIAWGKRAAFSWFMSHDPKHYSDIRNVVPIFFETRTLDGTPIPLVRFKVFVVAPGHESLVYAGMSDDYGRSPIFGLPQLPWAWKPSLQEVADQTHYVLEVEAIVEGKKVEWSAIFDPQTLLNTAWLNPLGASEWSYDGRPWEESARRMGGQEATETGQFAGFVAELWHNVEFDGQLRVLNLDNHQPIKPVLFRKEWLEDERHWHYVAAFYFDSKRQKGPYAWPYPPEGMTEDEFKSYFKWPEYSGQYSRVYTDLNGGIYGMTDGGSPPYGFCTIYNPFPVTAHFFSVRTKWCGDEFWCKTAYVECSMGNYPY